MTSRTKVRIALVVIVALGAIVAAFLFRPKEDETIRRHAEETTRTEAPVAPEAIESAEESPDPSIEVDDEPQEPKIRVSVQVLDAEDFEPIADAAVQLVRSRMEQLGAGGPAPTSGRTDDSGQARLEVSRPGRYLLSGRAPTHGGSTDLVISEDDAVEPIVLALSRRSTVSGHVRSASGEPIEGARVHLALLLTWPTILDGSELWPAAVLTDAEGSFVFPFAPAQSVLVKAYHSRFSPGLTKSFEVLAHEHVDGVEIILSEGAGVVEGTVVDPNGDPVDRATVSIQDLDRGFENWPRRTVGPDGRFRFDGLSFTSYVFSFWAPGYFFNLHPDFGEGGFELTASEPEASVQLKLQAHREVSGVVVDGEDQPLGGVRITLPMPWGDPIHVGADGTFTLPARSHWSFSKAGYVKKTLQIPFEFDQSLRVVLERSALLRVEVVDPAAAQSERGNFRVPFSVEVRVILPDDEPEEDDDSEEKEDEDERLQRWAETLHEDSPDTNERFMVRAPSGYFEVGAVAGTTFVSARVPEAGTAEAEVITQPGETHDVQLVLKSTATLRGRVVRENDGVGIAGAEVSLQKAHEQPTFLDPFRSVDVAQTVTSDDGSFEISGAAPSEEWRVWTRARGFGIASSDTLRPTATSPPGDIVLRLVPEARVEGKLIGWEQPEEVRIRSPEALKVVDAKTETTLAEIVERRHLVAVEGLLRRRSLDEAGTFSAPRLPPGNYTVSCLDWQQSFTLGAGETKRFRIDLGGVESPLRGLLLQGGSPVTRARVYTAIPRTWAGTRTGTVSSTTPPAVSDVFESSSLGLIRRRTLRPSSRTAATASPRWTSAPHRSPARSSWTVPRPKAGPRWPFSLCETMCPTARRF